VETREDIDGREAKAMGLLRTGGCSFAAGGHLLVNASEI